MAEEPLGAAAAGALSADGTTRSDLARLADVVESAHDLESLTRPLLEALHDLTGLASTYLTVVHERADEQEIRFSLNSEPGFAVPEGLRVPWADTLCQRALAEGRPCTTEVEVVWGDSETARELGIQTYVSVPVRLPDGSLWGTLCGADSRTVEDAERHLSTLGMFARLIAGEVTRAGALAEAQRAAEVDLLTGCATRRGIEAWFERARESTADAVAAAFVDLDGFKAVNDTYGHAVGDAVLREAGRQLRGRSRSRDLVGRIGGDEFVVAALLSSDEVAGFVTRWSNRLDARVEVEQGVVEVRGSMGTAVLPPDRVEDLLAQADKAMYDAKHRARQSTA